jgi:hypothetical protein
MKPLLSILFALIINLTFGQNFQNDSIINRFVINLLDKGIDTILIYENGHLGRSGPIIIILNDSCLSFNEPYISYMIWKNENVSYISKISSFDCYEYDTISYDFKVVWDMYFNYKTIIKNEQIYPPMYIDKGDTFTLDIDHYSYFQIMIIDTYEKTEFEINDFYFTKTIEEGYTNLNYQRNIATLRKKLQILIDKEIKNIEANNLIKRKRLTTE